MHYVLVLLSPLVNFSQTENVFHFVLSFSFHFPYFWCPIIWQRQVRRSSTSERDDPVCNRLWFLFLGFRSLSWLVLNPLLIFMYILSQTKTSKNNLKKPRGFARTTDYTLQPDSEAMLLGATCSQLTNLGVVKLVHALSLHPHSLIFLAWKRTLHANKRETGAHKLATKLLICHMSWPKDMLGYW